MSTKENSFNGKNYAISIIRLMSLLLIVLCHFCQFYKLSIAWHFNIGVQFFLIISGFLYGLKYESFKIKKLGKCVKKLLIDFYIFCFFAITLNLIFNFKSLTISGIFKLLIMMKWLPGLEHLWYVPLILFCYFISPILSYIKSQICEDKKIDKTTKSLIVVVVTSLIIYSLCPNFNFVWVSLYVIAFMFAEELKSINKSFVAIMLFLVVLTAGTHITKLVLEINNYQVFSIGIMADIIRGITALTVYMLLYCIFSHIKFKQQIKVLDFSDKYSYNVYLCHQIFLLGPLSLLRITSSVTINIVIAIVAIVALTTVSILLSKLIKKITPKSKNCELTKT